MEPTLAQRASRAANPAAESGAFAALARALAEDPHHVFQLVAETACALCDADAAGVTLVEAVGVPPTLRWEAVHGSTAITPGARTPYPDALATRLREQQIALIAKDDTSLQVMPTADAEAHEMLVAPWLIDDTIAGTLCLLTGKPDRRFDSEDARVLQALASYVSAAWQLCSYRAVASSAREPLAYWVEDHAADVAAVAEGIKEILRGESRLRGLFRQAPGFMAILRGPDHTFEFYNDSYARLVGPRDLIGRTAREMFPEVEGQGFFEWLDTVYQTGGAHLGHETPLLLQTPGGLLKQHFIDFIYQAITDGSGRTTGIFVEGHDVTERVRNAVALKESEVRLRTLTEGIPQLVWRSVDDGSWTWSSPQWKACTGQDCSQSRGRGWLAAIHPDDRPAVLDAWIHARSRGSLEVEHRVFHKADGTWLWHHTRALPVRDSNGEILEWLGTSTDVQELKEMQDHQSVLVRELQHRTRNLIAVVRSMAEQSLSTAPSVEEFSVAFRDRLAALGRVQGLLARAETDPITIETLIRMELDSVGAFGNDEHLICLSGPQVTIRQSIVQTLALALHELAINARKHGALATQGGRLSVSWKVGEYVGKGPVLAVQWIEENAVDVVPTETTAGFGRYLIERALPYLGAETSFELEPRGARCDIEVPLGRRPSETSAPQPESGFS